MLKINKYPWCHIHQHPILVLLIVWNYRQRRIGKLPDKWYWADEKLMKLIPKIDNNLLRDNPYRDKFLYVCRQLSEEHKYILRLETIIGNQRKELKRLNNEIKAKWYTIIDLQVMVSDLDKQRNYFEQSHLTTLKEINAVREHYEKEINKLKKKHSKGQINEAYAKTIERQEVELQTLKMTINKLRQKK